MIIKKRKSTDKNRDKEIVKDYNSGMSIVLMVAKYLITSSRIYQILKEQNRA